MLSTTVGWSVSARLCYWLWLHSSAQDRQGPWPRARQLLKSNRGNQSIMANRCGMCCTGTVQCAQKVDERSWGSDAGGWERSGGWSEKTAPEGWGLSQPCEERWRSLPENGECKTPEVGIAWVWARNSKVASVAAAEDVKRTGVPNEMGGMKCFSERVCPSLAVWHWSRTYLSEPLHPWP